MQEDLLDMMHHTRQHVHAQPSPLMVESVLVVTAGQQHLKSNIWATLHACAIEAHLHVCQLSQCSRNLIDSVVPVLSSHAVLLGLRHKRDVSICVFAAFPLKKVVLV